MIKKIIICFAAILMLFGCTQKEVTEQKPNTELSGNRAVKTSVAELADISSYIEFSGKLSADETVNLAPSISAQVIKLLVDEGDVVKKGDLLAELDDTQLKQAETQFLNTEKNYNRMSELYKSGAIEGATFDEVETAYHLAESSWKFMRVNTHILAPIDGVISNVYKNAGEYYNNMMDPFLIRMVNLNKIKAIIQVSDTDLAKVKLGQNVLLTVNNSDLEFPGKVSFISPEADQMSGTFQVELTIQNKENRLRNNQFTRVKLLTETVQSVIVIPQTAIINNTVFTVENGKAVIHQVTFGIGNEYNVAVLSGIKAGDVVITAGSVGLSEGDFVKIEH
ncbi:MAG TPA: efflux RND transporter periplasmic adaptor subunit [Candidatus Cloacimonadota bacterium]|nr:efflux RND transporter periplasmic adaptor subunit [Candidatus Cloacimonadota bacterium]